MLKSELALRKRITELEDEVEDAQVRCQLNTPESAERVFAGLRGESSVVRGQIQVWKRKYELERRTATGLRLEMERLRS